MSFETNVVSFNSENLVKKEMQIRNKNLYLKAAEKAELVQKTNLAVARIAIAVYVIIFSLALYYRAWILVLFSTCLLLAVRVVYLFIVAVILHLELLRDSIAGFHKQQPKD